MPGKATSPIQPIVRKTVVTYPRGARTGSHSIAMPAAAAIQSTTRSRVECEPPSPRSKIGVYVPAMVQKIIVWSSFVSCWCCWTVQRPRCRSALAPSIPAALKPNTAAPTRALPAGAVATSTSAATTAT